MLQKHDKISISQNIGLHRGCEASAENGAPPQTSRESLKLSDEILERLGQFPPTNRLTITGISYRKIACSIRYMPAPSSAKPHPKKAGSAFGAFFLRIVTRYLLSVFYCMRIAPSLSILERKRGSRNFQPRHIYPLQYSHGSARTGLFF